MLGPREVQQRIGREARELLAGFVQANAGRLGGLVESHLWPTSHLPDTANHLLYDYFRPALVAAGASRRLQAVLREVVQHAVLAGARERRNRWQRALLRFRAHGLQEIPDPLGDLLAGRRDPVSWKQIRTAWVPVWRRLTAAQATSALYERMAALFAQRAGAEVDLAQLAQEVCSTYSLLPAIIDGLSDVDDKRIRRDVTNGLTDLAAMVPQRGRWRGLRTTATEIRAGFVVRAELRGRARGRRPRRSDLADPLVDMLPEIGYGRAVDAVTALLTAIAGPPGAIGACLLFAMHRHRVWTERLRTELAQVPAASLHAHAATPVTTRFVKEALRLWGPPLLLARTARVPISVPPVELAVGQTYVVSPHLIHRDPARWTQPELFDPQRWLTHTSGLSAGYVPFGLPPKTCAGATLGMVQLIALCHLLCTRYRIEWTASPRQPEMALGAVAFPVNLYGVIRT